MILLSARHLFIMTSKPNLIFSIVFLFLFGALIFSAEQKLSTLYRVLSSGDSEITHLFFYKNNLAFAIDTEAKSLWHFTNLRQWQPLHNAKDSASHDGVGAIFRSFDILC